MKEYHFFVYILSSHSGTLYIGMTNNLERRISEHKLKLTGGFTKQYGCDRLVYYEDYKYAIDAIGRETQLKKWTRVKKENLIKTVNPHWDDLSAEWR
ncbi:MAG: GIY-YIG nuclease family protein [bacterium]|nr:GIY-YIG nuclease family protein [bacterium]